VCFYIPKKEQNKKRQFERAISPSLVWVSFSYLETTSRPFLLFRSSTKPDLTPPTINFALARIEYFSTHSLIFFSVSTASKCFTAVSGVQLRGFLGVVSAYLLAVHF